MIKRQPVFFHSIYYTSDVAVVYLFYTPYRVVTVFIRFGPPPVSYKRATLGDDDRDDFSARLSTLLQRSAAAARALARKQYAPVLGDCFHSILRCLFFFFFFTVFSNTIFLSFFRALFLTNVQRFETPIKTRFYGKHQRLLTVFLFFFFYILF